MRARRRLLLLLCIALAILAITYGVLSGFARGPLTPSEFRTFAAAFVTATPAHLAGSDPLETLRLGGSAFGCPAKAALIKLNGKVDTIPLPPHTGRKTVNTHPDRFVTFATSEELSHYLNSTLPRNGWRYHEQLGSMHGFRRDDLFLSAALRFYVGTRVRQLNIQLHRPGRRE